MDTTKFKIMKPYHLFFICLVFLLGCGKDNEENSSSNKIANETDAYYEAMAVAHSLKNLCPPYSSDWIYNEKVISGVYGGSATVSGSYAYTKHSSKTYYEYNNIYSTR